MHTSPDHGTVLDHESALDHNSGVPFYRQIKDRLRAEITAGVAAPDSPLTEAGLIRRFGVSRAPARQALKELADEGYVYRKQGKGTYPVPGIRVERPPTIPSGGLFAYLEAEGHQPRTTISNLSHCIPPEHVQHELGLAPNEELLHFVRVLTAGDDPVAEITAYIRAPHDFTPTAGELEAAGSAFTLLERSYGITIERAEHIASATAATPEQARVLQVAAQSPLLKIDTTLYFAGGAPGSWRSTIHRDERFKYRFTALR